MNREKRIIRINSENMDNLPSHCKKVSGNKTHTLSTSMCLPLKRDDVFPFFADASNLETITPPELCFSILSPQPITINEGTIINYQLRLFGIPFKWRTRITLWEPPHRFIDEQISGPYRLWIHTHRFLEENESTTITDEVQYWLPWWPFGEVSYPFVYLLLKRIFSYRQKKIWQILVG
ncbi:MAG: SRPBCC family protein [Candidatus Scalindua rubra]|uniref:CDP-paratose 2-epimerase n=1 Tax=Candidatus Scalindua brodae TaxID=237368 RepID=A0A0B0ENC2_9BACT|nr:MAG: hypothetical protein SCABRO_02100 [Candidatus Scalindua brodae]MBZ0107887.1 SRPBCC family protein [Candidatus Scalindua rubra]